MTSSVKYPLGIQTFSKIIDDKLLYIDKTAIIYELLSQGSVYFLSRPRRFGKSLLISTLEALFAGRKALFSGLAIANSNYDFAPYPVITLEFSKVKVSKAEDLENYLINATNQYAEQYGIALEISSFEQRFEELVRKIHHKTGSEVVFLVDEYDKPILDNLFSEQLVKIKESLNGFYAMAKSLDRYWKFVFITGVTKFAKVSVFSGMNNLNDISMDSAYATLCGISQIELEHNFAPAIDQLAQQERVDRATLLDKIKHWYNGYRFEEAAPTVYNPFSLLCLFTKGKFKNYWFTTATPTFLLELLKKNQYELKNLSNMAIGDAAFAASEPEKINIHSLFLQTGYLTIKHYQAPMYLLGFPNFEVEKSFYDSVVGYYGNIDPGAGQSYLYQLTEQLKVADIDGVFDTLKLFFANIPYDITLKQEKYYQSLFYAIFTLLGMEIETEVRTNQGRIDCVITTDSNLYIIEFKLDGSKVSALAQIKAKNYPQKYQNQSRTVFLIGVEFNSQIRNIGEYIIEQL